MKNYIIKSSIVFFMVLILGLILLPILQTETSETQQKEWVLIDIIDASTGYASVDNYDLPDYELYKFISYNFYNNDISVESLDFSNISNGTDYLNLYVGNASLGYDYGWWIEIDSIGYLYIWGYNKL